MKYLLFISSISLVNSVIADPWGPTQDCVPTSIYRKDCNTCKCTDHGLEYCTKKLCSKPRCKIPGVVRMKDCNRCVCQESGEEVCEENHCYEQQCRPNSSFRLDCNNCRCTNTGKDYICSRVGCYGDFTMSGSCIRGFSYLYRGHTCICDDSDGLVCKRHLSRSPLATSKEGSVNRTNDGLIEIPPVLNEKTYGLVDRVIARLSESYLTLFNRDLKLLFREENLSKANLKKAIMAILRNGAHTLDLRILETKLYGQDKNTTEYTKSVTRLKSIKKDLVKLYEYFEAIGLDNVPKLYDYLEKRYLEKIGISERKC